MRELFIYYRLQPQHAGAAQAAVFAFQARLRSQHAGLTARLYRRCGATPESQTWMETYALESPGDAAGVTAGVQAIIEAEASCLAPFTDGTRHVEVFERCAS